MARARQLLNANQIQVMVIEPLACARCCSGTRDAILKADKGSLFSWLTYELTERIYKLKRKCQLVLRSVKKSKWHIALESKGEGLRGNTMCSGKAFLLR